MRNLSVKSLHRAAVSLLAAGVMCGVLTSCSETQPLEISEANFPNVELRAYVSETYDADRDGWLSQNEIWTMRQTEGYWGALEDLPNDSALAQKLHERQELANSVAINAANFPDEAFRNYVSQNFDTNADGRLTPTEIAAVTRIDCGHKGIADLTGVEYFTELEYLACDNNNLTALDVSRNTKLRELYCSYNDLSSLDLSQNAALYDLACIGDNLTSLDLSHNPELTYLGCTFNSIDTLDISSNPKLVLFEYNTDKSTTVVKNGTVIFQGGRK